MNYQSIRRDHLHRQLPSRPSGNDHVLSVAIRRLLIQDCTPIVQRLARHCLPTVHCVHIWILCCSSHKQLIWLRSSPS